MTEIGLALLPSLCASDTQKWKEGSAGGITGVGPEDSTLSWVELQRPQEAQELAGPKDRSRRGSREEAELAAEGKKQRGGASHPLGVKPSETR